MSIVMVTVGIGENNSVEINTSVDGQLASTVQFTKTQAHHHMKVLARHIELLPDVPVPNAEGSELRQ